MCCIISVFFFFLQTKLGLEKVQLLTQIHVCFYKQNWDLNQDPFTVCEFQAPHGTSKNLRISTKEENLLEIYGRFGLVRSPSLCERQHSGGLGRMIMNKAASTTLRELGYHRLNESPQNSRIEA